MSHVLFATAPTSGTSRTKQKDLVKAGTAKSITDAQLKIARPLWVSELAEAQGLIESLEETGQLKQAIDLGVSRAPRDVDSRVPIDHVGLPKDHIDTRLLT